MSHSFALQTGPELGRQACSCEPKQNRGRLIAITGGPGAGKTAVLRLAANVFCRHVAFLPESATLLFSGGFWRRPTLAGLEGLQTAIFHTQRQLEYIFQADQIARFALCDRGTVDGAAYWPSGNYEYWEGLGLEREEEILRYAAVIHLRSPQINEGYDLSNPARTEDFMTAHRIDEAIFEVWKGHPRRYVIEANGDFQAKTDQALAILKSLIQEGVD